MKVKKNRLFVICAAFMLFIVGCGIKSNPVPVVSMVDYRQMVSNIEAGSSDDAVVLKWDLNNKKDAIKNIFIERSEQGSAGNECPGCPQKYERIGQVEVSPSLLPSAQIKKQSFADKKVERGKIYNYRLMLCDDAGVCQDKPGAQINFK